MNKIFKVIYNRAKHCYVVASEFAKSYSKGGGSRTLRRAAVALLAAAVYTAAGSALAENSGGTVDGDGDYIGNADTNPPYTVTIEEGFDGNVYGHKGESEDVEGACVTVTNGTVNDNVLGGYSSVGSVASNSVNIKDGIIFSVIGGFTISKSVASNSVNISGGTVNEVLGGNSYYGDVASNSVNISGGTINGKVCGGQTEDTFSTPGNVYENQVNMTGGQILYNDEIDYSGSLFGGFSAKVFVASNSVNISGGTVERNVYGGYVDHGTGSASYNIVNIIGGTVN